MLKLAGCFTELDCYIDAEDMFGVDWRETYWPEIARCVSEGQVNPIELRCIT